jgi:hypothetical protein
MRWVLAFVLAMSASVFYARFVTSDAQVPLVGQAVFNQAIQSATITPSDTAVFVGTRALYNGTATACNIAAKLTKDTAAVTYNNVQPGEFMPIQAVAVMATNTTCTSIVGDW